MKVNLECTLKYFRFANSNDTIFKTDLASLKCNIASSFTCKMSWFFTEKVACEHRSLSWLKAGDTSTAIPAQFNNRTGERALKKPKFPAKEKQISLHGEHCVVFIFYRENKECLRSKSGKLFLRAETTAYHNRLLQSNILMWNPNKNLCMWTCMCIEVRNQFSHPIKCQNFWHLSKSFSITVLFWHHLRESIKLNWFFYSMAIKNP